MTFPLETTLLLLQLKSCVTNTKTLNIKLILIKFIFLCIAMWPYMNSYLHGVS